MSEKIQLDNLRTRVLLIVFSSTVLIGICTVLMIFFITFRNDLQTSKTQTEQMMDAVEYSAEIASYSGNGEIANDVIKGLLRSDHVCSATLSGSNNLHIASGKQADTTLCEETLSRNLHSPFDDEEIVGHLATQLDSAAIKTRAFRHAGTLAISLLPLVLLPGLIIWLAISRFITQPVQKLSEQLHQISPGTPDRIAHGKHTAGNEIEQLASDVNHLLNVVEITLEEEREQRLLVEQMSRKYELLAHHDTLTGLPNRTLFNDRLQQMLAGAQRSGQPCALIFMDLDGFKPINDTYGHDAGDALLKEVGTRLDASVRASDTVARLGGDEFVVLLPSIEHGGDATAVAEKIRRNLAEPILVKDDRLNIGVSIGIALYPEHGELGTTLIKNADRAMYQAKQEGKNKVCVYRADAALQNA